jgi:hypothetical protein
MIAITDFPLLGNIPVCPERPASDRNLPAPSMALLFFRDKAVKPFGHDQHQNPKQAQIDRVNGDSGKTYQQAE